MSDVPRHVVDLVDQRDGRIDRSTGRGLGAGRNLHHRRLRSRRGHHTPANLITLSGSGTTGTHGYMHANPRIATEHGFIVPSWADPAEVPILLADRRGRKAWHLLTEEGTTTPLSEADALDAMRALGLRG